MTKTFFAAILSLLALTMPVSADVLVTFQDSLQGFTPATGWAYLWNQSGPIGNPSNYIPMVATSDPNKETGGVKIFYDGNGGGSLPNPDPAAYMFFGIDNLTGTPVAGGHPGLSASQSGSHAIFAIVRYTVGTHGDFSIKNSLLKNTNNSIDGLNVRVYLNNNSAPLTNVSSAGGLGKTVNFDTKLGVLDPGDLIYVAIGPGNTDFSDGFQLLFSVSAVPEPTSFLLGGVLSCLGLVAARKNARMAAGLSQA